MPEHVLRRTLYGQAGQGLAPGQFREEPALFQQFGVASPFRDSPLIEDDDLIGIPHGGDAMGDEDDGPALGHVSQGGKVLEGRGVIPDTVAEPTREALLRHEDTALEAAIKWIGQQGRK